MQTLDALRRLGITAFPDLEGSCSIQLSYGRKRVSSAELPAAGALLASRRARQFNDLVAGIEGNGSGFSAPAADLVRLLAFTGLRLGEAAHVTWAEVDLKRGQSRACADR